MSWQRTDSHELQFYSVSTDGRVVLWSVSKNELSFQVLRWASHQRTSASIFELGNAVQQWAIVGLEASGICGILMKGRMGAQAGAWSQHGTPNKLHDCPSGL